jgi:hypothetical protein
VTAIALTCVVASGNGAAAERASSTLGVSVRVVRSCSVETHPVDGTWAAVQLACSSGHVADVLVGGRRLAADRSIRIAETEESSSGFGAVRVVTLNF